MANLNYIHVFFSNVDHSYVTDLSINTTVESVTDYFLNTSFDVGNFPIENMKNCVGFHFYDKKNNKDHFIGECSNENLKKFGLITCHIINSFKFNSIGDLISTPEHYNFNDLTIVHDHLIAEKQYISASRINHLIQVLNNA